VFQLKSGCDSIVRIMTLNLIFYISFTYNIMEENLVQSGILICKLKILPL